MLNSHNIKRSIFSRLGKLCVSVLLVFLLMFDTVSTGIKAFAYDSYDGFNDSGGMGVKTSSTDPNDDYIFYFGGSYKEAFLQRSAHWLKYTPEKEQSIADVFKLKKNYNSDTEEYDGMQYAYCSDVRIAYKTDTYFKQVTLEDAVVNNLAHFYKRTEGEVEYTPEEAIEVAEKIRAIVYNSYPFISFETDTEKRPIYVTGAQIDASNEEILTAWISKMPESVRSQFYDNGKLMLTIDEATLACQLAIWRYTNEDFFTDAKLSNGDEPHYFGSQAISTLEKGEITDFESHNSRGIYYSNSSGTGKYVYGDYTFKDGYTYFNNVSKNVKTIYDWLTSLDGMKSQMTDVRMKSSAKISKNEMVIKFKFLDYSSGKEIIIDSSDFDVSLEAYDKDKTPITGIVYTFNGSQKDKNGYYSISVRLDQNENIETVNLSLQQKSNTYDDVFFYLPIVGANAAQCFVSPGISKSGGIASISYKKENVNREIELYKEYKNEEYNLSMPISGAVFDLYKQVGRTPNVDEDILIEANLITGENGKIEYSGLEKGATYYFVETQAAPGYITPSPDNNENMFVVDENGKVTVVNDIDGQYNVRLVKTEGGKSKKVPDAVFELYRQNGSFCDKEIDSAGDYIHDENDDLFLGTFTTNDIGEITVENLPFGTYYFVEIEAPYIYNLNKTPHIFVIDADTNRDSENYIESITVENILVLAKLELTKLDSVKYMYNGQEIDMPISNVSFKYYCAVETNDVDQFLTATYIYDKDFDTYSEEDGTFSFDPLASALYYIVETSAPDGYVLASDYEIRYFFSVNRDDNGKNVDIEKVGYFDKDGNLMQDENGNDMFYDYSTWVAEKKGTDVQNVVPNDQIRSNIKVIKTDAETQKPLSGAEFEVYFMDGDTKYVVDTVKTNTSGMLTVVEYDENGNPLPGYAAVRTTGNDGTITFKNLPYGRYVPNGDGTYDYVKVTYYVRETKAPKGYVLTENSQAFEMTENGSTYEYNVTNKAMEGVLKINKIIKKYEFINNIDLSKLKFTIKYEDAPTFKYKDENGTYHTVSSLDVNLKFKYYDSYGNIITTDDFNVAYGNAKDGSDIELYICVEGLTLGTYTVTETDGTAYFNIYTLDNAKGEAGSYTQQNSVTFNVFEDGIYEVDYSDEYENGEDHDYIAELNFGFKNEYKLGDVSLIKWDLHNDDYLIEQLKKDDAERARLDGALFHVYYVNDDGEKILVKPSEATGITSDNYKATIVVDGNTYKDVYQTINGELSIENLPYGKYYYEEVGVILDNKDVTYAYDIESNKGEFTLNKNEYDIQVENERRTNQIKIKKTSEDYIVEGLWFNVNVVKFNGEKLSFNAQTDANGYITIDEVAYGTYTVTELVADTLTPTPQQIKDFIYQIPPSVTKVIDENSETPVEFEFHNLLKEAGLKLVKKDSSDKTKTLQGAEFIFYREITNEHADALDKAYNDKISEIEENGGDISGVERGYTTITVGTSTKKVIPLGTRETDSNGEIVILGLPYGTYYYKETKAPAGFVIIDDSFRSVTLNEDDSDKTIEYMLFNGKQIPVVDLEVFNRQIFGKVQVKKTDEDGKVLRGATFKLTYADGSTVTDVNGNAVTEKTTDANGICTFENIPYGRYVNGVYILQSYMITETSAPYGYVRNTTPIKNVQITEDGKTYEFTYVNKEILGKIVIEKRIAESIFLKVGSDVDWTKFKFEVTGVDKDGNAVVFSNNSTKLTVSFTDAHPSQIKVVGGVNYVYQDLEITDLPLGTYTITEIDGIGSFIAYGDGKLTSTVTKTITAVNDTTDDDYVPEITFDFENRLKTGKFTITKYDEASKKPMSGIEFALYQSDGTTLIKTVTTNASGIATVNDVPYGTYYFTELSKPVNYESGFIYNGTEYEYGDKALFTVDANNTNATISAYDKRIEYKYEINKTVEDGASAAGFYFRITGTNVYGEAVDIKVGPTDANGKITMPQDYKFYKADANGYTVTEELTDAQSKLYRQPDPKKATLLSDGKTYTVSFENIYKKGNLLIQKIDATTKKPINGIEFTIYTRVNGVYTEVTKGVTADMTVNGTKYSGVVYFQNLRLGQTYYYRETTDADVLRKLGYAVDTNYYSFVFESDGQLIQRSLENVRNTYWLDITKIAEDRNEAGFTYADAFTFTVTGKNVFGESVNITVKTDANGIAEVENLYLADSNGYTIHEVLPSDTKYIQPADIKVTNDDIVGNKYVYDKSANTIKFENLIKRGTLKLYKYEMISGKKVPLSNAVIAVYSSVAYDADGNVDLSKSVLHKSSSSNSGYYTTDADGMIVIENFTYGTYYYQEAKAPYGYALYSKHTGADGKYLLSSVTTAAGYALDTPVMQFNIQNNNDIVLREIENKRIYGYIEIIKKTDVKNGNLAGFEFKIEGTYEIPDENGNTTFEKTVYTDANGKVTKEAIGALPLGTYTITEVRNNVSQQFILPPDQTKSITYDGEKNTYTFENITVKKNLELFKYEELNGTKIPIQGAEFTIMGDSLSAPIIKTTDEDGMIECLDIPYGVYTYTETKPAPGYSNIVDGKQVSGTFVVDNNWDANDPATQVVHVEVANEKLKATLKIIKTAEGLTKGELEGFGFRIHGTTYVTNDNDYDQVFYTDENGEIFIDDLPYGIYTITEVETDKSIPYVIKDNTMEITFEGDKTLNIKNTYKKGSFKITKIDADTKEKLPGAVFVITNGKDTFTATSGADGIAEFNNVPYGDYEYTEITTPSGYIKDSLSSGRFSITYDGQLVEIEVPNKRANITLKIKKTSETGRVKGFDFLIQGETLITADDKPGYDYEVVKTTDANGEIILNDLPVGTYKVTELKNNVSAGFIIPEPQTQSAGVKDYGTVLTFNFYNKLERGELDFSKTDIVDDTPLPDTGIRIYVSEDDFDETKHDKVVDENGNEIIVSRVVDENGDTVAIIDENGDIVVIDSKDYKLDENDAKTLVDNNGNKIIVVDDDRDIIYSDDSLEITDYIAILQGYTDENGKIKFTEIPSGEYWYQEFDAPDGYLINDDMFKFVIDEDGDVEKAKMQDEREEGTLKLVKTSETGKVDGFTFLIEGITDSKVDNDFVKTVTTNSKGVIELTVPAGLYTVTELPIGPAVDYIIEAPKTIRVENDKTTTFSFYNDLKEGEVEITKTDIVDDEPLPDTVIRIYIDEKDFDESKYDKVIGDDGKPIVIVITDDSTGEKRNLVAVYEDKTDENGKVVFEDVPTGDYWYQEAEAPTGYMIDERPYPFTIGEDGEVVKAEMVDKLAQRDIKIIKTSENGRVQGFKFLVTGTTVFGEEIEPIEVTTGKNGTIIIPNLVAGTYVFEELEIEGVTDLYELPASKTITIPDGKPESYYDKPFEVSFYNMLKKRGGIEITKVDIVDDTPLPNTLIRITDEDGNVVNAAFFDKDGNVYEAPFEGYTDENGIIKFSLPEGNYFYQEVKAPDGYLIDTTPYPFTILNDEIVKATMKDERKVSSIEIIKTSNSGKVDGFKFLITGTTILGKAIKPIEVVTANGGYAKVDNLMLGTYTVKEVEIPGVTDDYILPAPQTVKITEENKTYKFNFYNELKGSRFEFTKVDIVDDTPLPNTGIRITDSEGNVIFEGYTDENGKIIIEHLPIGDYWYQEFDAPDGYKLDENPYPFSIKANGEVVKAVMKNERLPATGDTTNTNNMLLVLLASVMLIFVVMKTKQNNIQAQLSLQMEDTVRETVCLTSESKLGKDTIDRHKLM